MLFAGTAGLMCGGRLADYFFSRGHMDAYPRVILASIVGMMPFAIALGFVSTPGLAKLMLFISIFFSAFQGGIAAGTLQLMTPNEMRGQAAAVYFLASNLIGLGIGPTVVASFTDYVFKNDAAVGKSLALTAAIMCPLAIVIMLSGARKVKQLITEQQNPAAR